MLYRKAKTDTGKPLSECEGEFELVVPINVSEEEIGELIIENGTRLGFTYKKQYKFDHVDIVEAAKAIMTLLKDK